MFADRFDFDWDWYKSITGTNIVLYIWLEHSRNLTVPVKSTGTEFFDNFPNGAKKRDFSLGHSLLHSLSFSFLCSRQNRNLVNPGSHLQTDTYGNYSISTSAKLKEGGGVTLKTLFQFFLPVYWSIRHIGKLHLVSKDFIFV